MIFPDDIYSKTKKGTKMTDAEKAKVLMGVVLAVLVGTTALSSGLWGNFVPIPVMIIIIAVIWIFICIQIYRFVVFREQDRDLEESDMFLPYYKLRPGSTEITSVVGKFSMYELRNSSFMTVIQIRTGRSGGERPQHTANFFNFIQNIVHEKYLYMSIVVMKEDFLESKEAQNMLQRANNTKGVRLRATTLAICNEVLSFAETHGTILSYYIQIYAKSAYQKDDLEDVVVQITNNFRKNKHLHSLRSLEFLDQKGIFSFFRRFYGMGAIDLSLSKVEYNTLSSDVLKSIVVYRIVSKSGKSYSNPILDKIKTDVKYL